MIIQSKGNTVLGLLILAFVLGMLFMQNSQPETNKQQADFEQYYKIYSLELPANLQFAGEVVPMNDIEVKERYDKELLINVYWQSQTLLMIKRANRFFPIIEKILLANNIPSDFKYLAVAESGLQNVTSPAGAMGYWQFLDKTGKAYGLEITEEVDERMHLEKSTEAACKYFKQAYKELGSWALAAASYNMGIEGVKRQLQNQQIENYYDLYLNTETSRYVLRTLALKQILEHPKQFGYNVLHTHLYPQIVTRDIVVDTTIANLMLFSIQQGANYKELKLLNPWLKKSTLTVSGNKMYTIVLPKHKFSAKDTINGEDSLRE